jgi:MFS family permease
MTEPWQLVLSWGLAVGLGSGVVALVLGAMIVNRWFAKHQGLVMGIITASTATGQLVFLPMLAAVVQNHGWRPVVWIAALAAAAMIPLVALLVPEDPAAIGLKPYGAAEDAEIAAPVRANPLTVAFATLGRAAKSTGFWLLFASFFVCGASTNGLIGTHLISYCFDHGIPEVEGAGLLAAMGVFDLIGTTASGWLSDRFDARWLLFWYYGLRGLSLLYLPYSGFSLYGLSLFAVFYGAARQRALRQERCADHLRLVARRPSARCRRHRLRGRPAAHRARQLFRAGADLRRALRHDRAHRAAHPPRPGGRARAGSRLRFAALVCAA